ncbi:CCR4 [Hepatospora eriocheir]|uniref:CCR4 n=1 Tax=Hepatospora eriocheir TaxID=1081669 RepID=A0A1X0QKZ8_9MICR|nr:CCR4 [Hepatospora eriocheir]
MGFDYTAKNRNHNEQNENDIQGLDMSFQGIKNISDVVFKYLRLKELLLNNNDLEIIPLGISKLPYIEKIDLSHNRIKTIPPELGRAVNLRELLLNDNLISTVPMEIGSLYNLVCLNLTNNPLMSPFHSLYKDGALLRFCRDNNNNYKPPNTRMWVETSNIVNRNDFESISVGTYNILSNFNASKILYTPLWTIAPESRKDIILKNIISYDLDILCLQEVETYLYYECYRDGLYSKGNYQSSYFEKMQIEAVKDTKIADGCAIFWKNERFKLVEEFKINFYNRLTADTRLKNNYEIHNLYGKRGEVGLVVVLEKGIDEVFIVVNTQLCTEPNNHNVRLLQMIFLLEDLEKIRNKYKGASVVIMGDLASTKESKVYDLIMNRKTEYNPFGLKTSGHLSDYYKHTLKLITAYEDPDGSFTCFTPVFKGIVDHILYSDNLIASDIITLVEDDYTERTVGLPNIHFPSNHILIGAKLCIKPVFKKNYKPKSIK